MIQRRVLGHLGRDPLYNTRAVVQRTDVPADTFRAWERRYGLPCPYRASSNQRLYSERDIGVITWLRDRTVEGMTISQAVRRLKLEHPEVAEPTGPLAPEATSHADEPQLKTLSDHLVEAVVNFDARMGERAIDEALALFSVEEACACVVQPAMAEIGERWRRGEIPASLEHFATRLVMRRLAMIFNMASSSAGRGTIITACAPTEEHEVGPLMLSIFLARHAWKVIFLGTGVPVEDLLVTVRQIKPDLVCLSATTTTAIPHAMAAALEIVRGVNQPPAVAYGGRAFARAPDIQPPEGAYHVTGGPDELAARIGAIVEARMATLRTDGRPRRDHDRDR